VSRPSDLIVIQRHPALAKDPARHRHLIPGQDPHADPHRLDIHLVCAPDLPRGAQQSDRGLGLSIGSS
jgi:hypothetical protein